MILKTNMVNNSYRNKGMAIPTGVYNGDTALDEDLALKSYCWYATELSSMEDLACTITVVLSFDWEALLSFHSCCLQEFDVKDFTLGLFCNSVPGNIEVSVVPHRN